MVQNKTSVLLRLCLRFISTLNNQSPEQIEKIIQFGNAVGAAFQIQDDVIAVTSEKYRKERGIYAEDIHEGKKTLMVIHNYYYGWKGNRLLEILQMKTKDEALLKEAVQMLQDEGSIEYAINQAQ